MKTLKNSCGASRRKGWAAVLAAAAMSTFWVTAAAACSCGEYGTSAHQLGRVSLLATIIFDEPKPTESSGDTGRYIADGRVVTVVKGEAQPGQTVKTHFVNIGGECGNFPWSGTQAVYGLYLSSDDTFVAPFCEIEVTDDVSQAFARQKAEIEKAATAAPADLEKQLSLAKFYVDWNEAAKADRQIKKLQDIMQGDDRLALIKAEFFVKNTWRDSPERQEAFSILRDLSSNNDAAKLLLVDLEGRAAWLDGGDRQGSPRFAKDIVRRTVPAPLDVSGKNFTGHTFHFADIGSAEADGSDWTAADMSKANLTGGNFDNAIFTQSVLYEVNFSGSSLRRAKFVDASLNLADFSGANAALANFQRVEAYSSKFIGTDLRGADFRFAILDRADFSNSDLRGANFNTALADIGITWTGARYDCHTRFRKGFQPERNGLVRTDDNTCEAGAQTGK